MSEAQIDAAVAAGRQRWPQVRVNSAAFRRTLAERLARPTGGAVVESAHFADLFLACACASRDVQALEVFERELLSHVPSYVSKLALSRVELDELTQGLREGLLVGRGGAPALLEYAGTGP